jgi:hypothetical protein
MALSTEQQDAQDKFDLQCAWAWLLGVAALGAAIGVIYEVGYEVKLGSSADWWLKMLATAWLAAFVCWSDFRVRDPHPGEGAALPRGREG